MKKKQIFNLIMVLAIVLILGAGIAVAGNILGWFDRDTEEAAELFRVQGIVTLERDGLACDASAGTALRQGDRLQTAFGAEAELKIGNSTVTLGEKTEMKILCPDLEHFSASVEKGEIFAGGDTPMSLSFAGHETEISDAVMSLSVRTGAQSLSVYGGSLIFEGTPVETGKMLSLAGTEEKIIDCQEASLNDFLIRQLRNAPGELRLCFTAADLDRLTEERQKPLPVLSEAATDAEKETEVPTEAEPETETAAETTESVLQAEEPADTEPPAEAASSEEIETSPEETELQSTCTLTIRCDTILENMDQLDPGKTEFVPESGYILWGAEIGFEDGETAFDVLKRACDQYGIQLEYSWTPMYDSYYVEGINCLYEFDCGSESGWMYQVNGWFPNYGCSEYTLKDGDRVVFCYTCNGLGADVGGGVW